MTNDMNIESVDLGHLIRYLKARKDLIKARAAYRKDPRATGIDIKLPSVAELWKHDLVWVLPSDGAQPGLVAGIEPFTYTSVNGLGHDTKYAWFQDGMVRVRTAELLDVCEQMVAHVEADIRYDVQLRLDGFHNLCVMHKESELRVRASDKDEGWLPDSVKFHVSCVMPHSKLPLEAMQRVRPVASKDTTRGNLNGVHYNHRLHRVEATDGHRAHIIKLYGDVGRADRSFIVDSEILDFAKTLKVSDAYFHTTDRKGTFILLGNHTWVQQRPEDTFPLLANTIDSHRLSLPASWIAPRKELVKAVTAAKGRREAPHDAVVIAASNDTAAVWAWNRDAAEKVTTDYVTLVKPCGDTVKKFGVSPNYLLDAIKLLGSKDIHVNLDDEYSPIYFTSGDFGQTILCVVMPMRI